MIVDTLDNIDLYKSFSNDIYLGLKFLKETSKDIEIGEYLITANIRAIVEEYKTFDNSQPTFESHKSVIDIQYPVIGLERVLWSPIANMSVLTPYNKIKDCTIFVNPNSQTFCADIGNRIFAIMFENDGHSPKNCIKSSELIKKITIKVSI